MYDSVNTIAPQDIAPLFLNILLSTRVVQWELLPSHHSDFGRIQTLKLHKLTKIWLSIIIQCHSIIQCHPTSYSYKASCENLLPSLSEMLALSLETFRLCCCFWILSIMATILVRSMVWKLSRTAWTVFAGSHGGSSTWYKLLWQPRTTNPSGAGRFRALNSSQQTGQESLDTVIRPHSGLKSYNTPENSECLNITMQKEDIPL
jgi:hypothetical protein